MENISGKWTGTVTYGPEYKKFFSGDLFFDIDLIYTSGDNGAFIGVANDIAGDGITPYPATIAGYFFGTEIQFVKQYNAATIIKKGVISFDESKQGPEIFYNGSYNQATGIFSGNWRIEHKKKLLGLIAVIATAGTGTWTMHRMAK